MVNIYVLLALGFDFLAHFVGLVSLGGAFFVGTGGYIAAILNKSFGLPPLLTLPIATVAGASICTFLLLPCLPLRGVYFAIVTLMYPLAISRVIEALNILGGTDGILGVARFPNRWIEQYLIIFIVIFCLFGLRRLVNEDIGLVFRGVKDNDQAIRASGLSITFYKAVAVFITAATRLPRGGLSGSHLHVVRDLPIRPRFLHPAHCRNRDRRRGHPGRSPDRMLHPDSHLRIITGLWDPANRLLCPDPDDVHHVQKRGDHGLCPAKISPI